MTERRSNQRFGKADYGAAKRKIRLTDELSSKTSIKSVEEYAYNVPECRKSSRRRSSISNPKTATRRLSPTRRRAVFKGRLRDFKFFTQLIPV